MSTFKPLHARRLLPATSAPPTSSLLPLSRPLVPETTLLPGQVPPDTYENFERARHVGFSFANIPLFPTVQRKAVLPSLLQEGKPLQSRIQAARSRGTPLDNRTQQRLEQELDTDLSGVRIHTDTEADHLARSVNATAFTTGADIFFQEGRYHPTSVEGAQLLTHEVTHVVQQATEPLICTEVDR